MEIGEAVKHIREYAKMNQMEFSERIGVTQSYLSKVENNHGDPSTSFLKKVCEVAELPMAVLMWHSMTKDDVPEGKRQAYELLKPHVDGLMLAIFGKNIV